LQPTLTAPGSTNLSDAPTRPSGWAFALHLRLEDAALKTPGIMLGGFALSIASETDRIGFGLWKAL